MAPSARPPSDVVKGGNLLVGVHDRRTLLRRAAALGLSVTVLGGIGAACGGSSSGGSGGTGGTGGGGGGRPGGRLKLGLTDTLSTMDLTSWSSPMDVAACFTAYDGLTFVEPENWTTVNRLAETLEMSEDGKTFTFKLREGVQFHGGYGEVTAEDVAFTFLRTGGLMKGVKSASGAGDWAGLKDVKVTGTYTGEILFEDAFAPLTTITLPGPNGLIMSKKATLERGKKIGQQPIGCGPYEVVEFVPNQRVVLKLFPEWWGTEEYGQPAWDEVELVTYTSAEPLQVALLSGELDFGGPNDPSSLPALEGDSNLQVVRNNTLGHAWVGFNVQHPKLQDVKVRQAIRYAVDVPALIEVAFEGEATRAHSPVQPELGVGFWEDAPQYERDVEQAKSLLAESGQDGLSLTLMAVNQNKTACEVIQQNLAEVGIDVSIELVDDATFYTFGPETLEREFFYHDWTVLRDPDWVLQWFTCDQVTEWNLMQWCNEEFSQLRNEAVAELDPEIRTDLYIQMQQLMDEDVCAVWVAYPRGLYAAKQAVEPAISGDKLYAHSFQAA